MLHVEDATWLNRGRVALLQQLMKKHLTKSTNQILDVGAGSGVFVNALSDFGEVDALEVSSRAWPRLSANPDIRTLYKDPLPEACVGGPYDLIVAMDVLEHIEDDRSAAGWIAENLCDGGKFIATVPAYMWMFGDHDRANHHFRRYTRSSLLRILPSSIRVLTCGYFNTVLFPAAVAGRAAWQVKQQLFGRSRTAKQSSELPAVLDLCFGSILSCEANVIRRGIIPPFGLSVFCVASR